MKGKATKLQLMVMVVEWMRKMIMTHLENKEYALEDLVPTKVVKRSYEKKC